MKKIVIDLYGEGNRLDLYDEDGGVCDCFNGYSAGEYFNIKVGDKEYSFDDFGEPLSKWDWPEGMDYEEDEEPTDVYDFRGCELMDDDSLEGIENITLVQTKVPATITIELEDDEEFDPKKLHFMTGEFVVPDSEIEINQSVVYNGKQYPIEMDIDGEREIADQVVWEA